LLHYKQAAINAVYAWELLAGRRATTEPLFVTGLLFGLCAYLYVHKIKLKLIFLLLVSFYTIALILTFSRGYWFGAVLGIVALLIMLHKKPRNELLSTIIGITFAVLVVSMIIFGSLGSSILDVVIVRMGGSSLSLVQDPSLHARYNETQSVIQYIALNPIIGYGLGSTFRFFNPILGAMQEVFYIHNGYLFLWFKLGIVGLGLFLLIYIYRLWEAIKIIYKSQHSLDYFLLCAIASMLIAMLAISITSPQFISRDSILIIATCWALIGASKHNSEGERL
jgi:O-antigen ligase